MALTSPLEVDDANVQLGILGVQGSSREKCFDCLQVFFYHDRIVSRCNALKVQKLTSSNRDIIHNYAYVDSVQGFCR